MIDLVSRLLFIELKMLLMNLLKQFLNNISNAKKKKNNQKEVIVTLLVNLKEQHIGIVHKLSVD